MKYILLILMMLIIGCDDQDEDSGPWIAHVESNTSWSGSFNNATVAGSGNRTITLSSNDIDCCCVQKQTVNGSLHVWIEDGESGTTTAPYGMVCVCGSR
jgi:hypothetical protein